jgi:carboxypeptidase C (cathepsin A)
MESSLNVALNALARSWSIDRPGGHYVPAWANAVLDHNAAHADAPLTLQGLMIGNGIVNETVQDTAEQYELFAKVRHDSRRDG